MSKKDKSLFAINLIKYRKSLGYTQEQISKELGIDRSRYGYYEIDVTPPPDILLKISSILGVSIDSLFKDDESEKIIQYPDQTMIDVADVSGIINNYSPSDFSSDTELLPDEKSLLLKYKLLSKSNKAKVAQIIDD
ncbi:MAG: helix-turn-helix transcriptional regulator, partial [bacterium]|nr:helix-turn-helix transcriptional regulator [bacterium]